jgi:hypothetical protein
MDLFELPDYLSMKVLTVWIDTASLLALDSSCCSEKSRKAFLVLLGSREFCLPYVHSNEALCSKGMLWFVARKAKVERVLICGKRGFDFGAVVLFLHTSGSCLQEVRIENCSEMISSILALFTFSSTRLKLVALRECHKVGSKIFGALLSTCASTMKHLSLVNGSLCAPLTASRLPNLQSLHVWFSRMDLSTVHNLLSSSTSLRSFYGAYLFAPDESFEDLAVNCPLLQVMSYRAETLPTPSSLVRLLQACPLIEVVSMGACGGGADQAALQVQISAVMRHCTGLRAFSAPGHGMQMADESLLAVVHRLRDLRHLRLYDCNPTTDAPVLAMAKNCENLRTLELRTIKGSVSQAALTALVRNLKRAEELTSVQEPCE